MPAPIGHAHVVKLIKTKRPHMRVLDRYVGRKQTPYLLARCSKHQIELQYSVKQVLSGTIKTCPSCRLESLRSKNALPLSELESRLRDKFPSHKIVSEFVNTATPVTIHCSTHDLTFEANLNNILYNGYTQCPGCKKPARNSPSIGHNNDRYSVQSMYWMAHECLERGWKFNCLRTALHTKGELGLGSGQYVDGWHSGTNTVLEFDGDYWHGRPRKDGTPKSPDRQKAWEKTKSKRRRIRSQGYVLVQMWESDWKKVWATFTLSYRERLANMVKRLQDGTA